MGEMAEIVRSGMVDVSERCELAIEISKHAHKQMQERGAVEQEVNAAIRGGEASAGASKPSGVSQELSV